MLVAALCARPSIRWLQIQFDFHSTAVRLLKVIKVTVTLAATTQTYLFTYCARAPRVGALSDDARLTSVCHVHRA